MDKLLSVQVRNRTPNIVFARPRIYYATQVGRRPPAVVVCFGYGGYVREDTRRLEGRGLGPHFRFLPFEPNIARSLRGVDVVAMPSLWESCGLLAMEAMVAGVPLIGTDCIGLREVMRGTPHKKVPKADGRALAEALA